VARVKGRAAWRNGERPPGGLALTIPLQTLELIASDAISRRGQDWRDAGELNARLQRVVFKRTTESKCTKESQNYRARNSRDNY
jgi:hypothetical protein